MSLFYQNIPAGLINLHSSNPDAFTSRELKRLVGEDVFEIDDDHQLSYETTTGANALRKAIAENLYDAIDAQHLITTSGAQEAIFCLMHALLTAEDEVIVFTPIFEPLIAIAQHIGCAIKRIELSENNQWQPDIQQLKDSITQKTKLLVINFPHNPTGAIIQQSELDEIIELCRKEGVWLFSDEVFRGLEHNPVDRLSAVVDSYEKGISMGVMSKAFALPGIRIGWLASHCKKLRQRIVQIKSQLSICHSLIDTLVSLRIFPHSDLIFARNVALINKNKAQLSNLLSIQDYPIELQLPIASATCFPLLKQQSAEKFSTVLMKENHQLVLPAHLFETTQNGFRLSLGIPNGQQQYVKLLEALKS